MVEPHFPGTQPPERRAQVESFGLQLNLRVLLAEDGSTRPPWWEDVRTSPTAVAVSGSIEEMLAVLAMHSRHAAAG